MAEKDPVYGEQLAKFLEIDVRCWKAAIQIHNRDVVGGKNKADKYYITVEGDNLTALGDVVCVSPVASADDLIKAAETAHRNLVGKQGKGARVFYSIVSCFQMYSKAIDVFIQQEPRTTALIWGTIRILLQAAVDSEEASEVTANGILLIAQHAGRWAKMARCFGYEPAVEEALTDLYVQVLGFVLPAMHHLHKGPWERLGKSLLCSVSRKLNARLSKLKDASKRLDQMVQLETNEKILSLFSGLDAPMGRARVMTDALLSYNGDQGRRDANLDAPKIKEWFSAAANPIAARPQGLAVATASIDEAEPYIVRHPQWQNWLMKPHLKPLWVSGAPGCGKSTIAHKCVEYLAETQDSSTIVSHAFESTGPTEHRRLMGLAASILDQLLPRDWVTQAQKHVFEKLVSLSNQYRLHSYDCPFEQLWDHCASLLKSETRFILVIDALDECDFDRADQFQGFLDRILDLLSSTTGRILIFTRPCPVFGVGVTRELNDGEIRISIQDTLPEINAFCDSASAKLPLPKELQLKVANRARAGAQGSFLWASLFLGSFTNVLDKNHVMEIIDEFPDNCWEFYVNTWRDRVRDLEPRVQDNCRRILLVLLGARQKLSLEDIEDSLDLLPNAAQRISKACQPLVNVVDGGLQLSHASVREFLLNDDKETQTARIGISKSEPDETLARTCLKYLLREDYAHTDRIGQRLRRNVGLGGSTEGLEQNFYNYAARNWYKHLAALSNPDPSLLKLAEQFLHAIQFAYWAEYSYTDAGDFQAIRSTEIALHIWMKDLPDDDRALLRLDDYFERPYRNLTRVYREKSDDKVLQWLALMHLGFYYFDKGKMSEMAQARQEVADGLSELLGRLNPLTLRARSDEAYTFLFSNDLRKAQRLYAEVYDDQRRVSKDDDPSLFFTLVYQGQVEYLMTNSSKALEILTSAVAGFLRTSGPESNGFLISQLWYAVADASVGHTSQAVKMMEYVREKREERYGPDDSFGMATKIFAGDLYRKLEKKEEALANIEPALEFRRGFWSKSHFLTIDTALVLAATYRDFGMNDLAEKIVDDLELNGKLEKKENYFRLCQVRHLRGLLLFDGGDVDQAITLLEALLIEHGHEDSNNRALQWVRLDLAEMLRYRGREGDERLASSLFDGIVTDGGDREPDPPRWLEISEEALRLVRDGKLDAAEDLLREEKLRWAREEDLWMCLGMPAADTGWMKPPRGLGAHAPGSGWVSMLPE